MAQDLSQEQFDISCLRRIATDPEARRVSLAAAMIKLHALGIARSAPHLREEALEIVRHLEELYTRLPHKASLKQVLGDHPASSRLGAFAIEDLADAVWDHVRCGRDGGDRPKAADRRG